jgi:uncharacterized protein YdeI (BOF family)
MKKLLLLFLSMLFLPLIFQNNTDAKNFSNEPDGFRGIKWETNVSKVKGLQNKDTVYSYGDITYTRKNDKFEVAGAKVEKIRYLFTNGKFTGVSIEFKDNDNFNSIKEGFFKEYGSPNHFNNTTAIHEEYMWKGKKTLIRLFYLKSHGNGSIDIFPSKYTKF